MKKLSFSIDLFELTLQFLKYYYIIGLCNDLHNKGIFNGCVKYF